MRIKLVPEDHSSTMRAKPRESSFFERQVEEYDRNASVVRWDGPRYRLTARVLGTGPPLLIVPGVASTYRGYCLTLNQLSARFRTVIYDYPGDDPNDGARLASITHPHLVDDLVGLIDHLALGPTFLFGLSFGSTVTLAALHREPERFPRAAIQGGFAHRRFSRAELLALRLGRMIPGNVSRLPLQGPLLALKNRRHFPPDVADRWPYYVAQNGLTPISALAHRLDLIARTDLRPVLPEIGTEVLLVQGEDDPIVAHSHFEELKAGLPRAEALVLPKVGHQPHFSHAEWLAEVVGEFFLREGSTDRPPA
jgi:pimeloyl-ACP methyl ester carboxylesterase